MAERNIEALGVEFTVDTEKLGGWHVFNLLKQAQSVTNSYEQVAALLEIACYITGLDEQEFVERCGGEDAPVQNIVATATEIITKAYPKN